MWHQPGLGGYVIGRGREQVPRTFGQRRFRLEQHDTCVEHANRARGIGEKLLPFMRRPFDDVRDDVVAHGGGSLCEPQCRQRFFLLTRIRVDCAQNGRSSRSPKCIL